MIRLALLALLIGCAAEPKAPPPAVEPSVDPADISLTGRYMEINVLAGDTLPGLATDYYGDERLWPILHDANLASIARAGLIPGLTLRVPILGPPEGTELPSPIPKDRRYLELGGERALKEAE